MNCCRSIEEFWNEKRGLICTIGAEFWFGVLNLSLFWIEQLRREPFPKAQQSNLNLYKLHQNSGKHTWLDHCWLGYIYISGCFPELNMFLLLCWRNMISRIFEYKSITLQKSHPQTQYKPTFLSSLPFEQLSPPLTRWSFYLFLIRLEAGGREKDVEHLQHFTIEMPLSDKTVSILGNDYVAVSQLVKSISRQT